MSAVVYLHIFKLVKIFAPGVASVIQDFAAVCVCGDLVSIFAAIYLTVFSILCTVMPSTFLHKDQGNGE